MHIAAGRHCPAANCPRADLMARKPARRRPPERTGYWRLIIVLVVVCYAGWQVAHSRGGPQGRSAATAQHDGSGSVSGIDRISSATGLAPSQHFIERLQERGISADEVIAAVQAGQVFYDPKNESTIYWKDGVYVAVAPGGTLKTAIRGPVEGRWVPR